MGKLYVPVHYELISGALSNLQWRKGSEDFVFTQTDKNVAGGAAVGAAALGQVFNAGGLAMASGDTSYTMSYFIGMLGDKIITGRFYEPNFKDGDEMEMVAERGGPNGEVYEIVAARRPADRILWLLPDYERGYEAHKRHSLKWALIMAFVIVPLCAVGMFFIFEGISNFDLKYFLFNLGCGFLVGIITLAISYEMYTKTIGKAYEMTGILKILGYAKPEWVDVRKTSKIIVERITKETGKFCHRQAFSYRY